MPASLAVGGSLGVCASCCAADAGAVVRDSAGRSAAEWKRVLGDIYNLQCLVGSDGHRHHRCPPGCVTGGPKEFTTSPSQPPMDGDIYIMEIFGGEIGASKVCIRRRPWCGRRSGLVTVCDSLGPKRRVGVLRCID